MKTTVLAFASLREALGWEARELDIPSRTVAGDIWQYICPTHATHYRQYMRVAVNRRYVTNDTELKEGDEIALIPPVAGG